MTGFVTHPTFEQLSDHLDQRPTAGDWQEIELHRAGCSECEARFRKLEALRASARVFPVEVAPPPALWHDVEARITQAMPSGRRLPTRFWHLAAAVLLAAFSSGVTLLIVRWTTRAVVSPAAVPVTRAALTAAPHTVDADYASAIRELNETLAKHRPELDPTTVAKVEASLRIIDLAITEARHALARDPANRTLIDLLAASYERKVELLRRANELPPST
jgi:anti-sigma factor RsiW